MSFKMVTFRSYRIYEAGMLAHGFFFRRKPGYTGGLLRVIRLQIWIVVLCELWIDREIA